MFYLVLCAYSVDYVLIFNSLDQLLKSHFLCQLHKTSITMGDEENEGSATKLQKAPLIEVNTARLALITQIAEVLIHKS